MKFKLIAIKVLQFFQSRMSLTAEAALNPNMGANPFEIPISIPW